LVIEPLEKAKAYHANAETISFELKCQGTFGPVTANLLAALVREFNRAQDALRDEMLDTISKGPTHAQVKQLEDDMSKAVFSTLTEKPKAPVFWVCRSEGCSDAQTVGGPRPTCYTCGEGKVPR
jgi:hypothetical protein